MTFGFRLRAIEIAVAVGVFFVVWIARYVKISREDRKRQTRQQEPR